MIPHECGHVNLTSMRIGFTATVHQTQVRIQTPKFQSRVDMGLYTATPITSLRLTYLQQHGLPLAVYVALLGTYGDHILHLQHSSC